MNNFLEFIEKDIEAKKTLISSLPTKTIVNKKNYNAKIETIIKKYSEYKNSVRNYLLAKNKSFYPSLTHKDSDILREKVANLEYIKFLLNPLNSYFEKMGFDNLLYQISNYYTFNFTSLTEIINQFFAKFALAGIEINESSFDYTCYVSEYMKSFLEVKKDGAKSFAKVSEVFEKIYWVNPDIIEHIELNFRKLIRLNAKKFEQYIKKVQQEIMKKNNIKNYNDCLEKLHAAYAEMNQENEENILDIIKLGSTNVIDITHFFKESKVRENIYSTFICEGISQDNEKIMNQIYDALKKLKYNIIEYKNYLEIIPLIENFNVEYKSLIGSNNTANNLKDIIGKISKNEKELEKLNKKIFNKRIISEDVLKPLKMKSVNIAKELHKLYQTYDVEYFKSAVITKLNNCFTTNEFLHLYYSFDYFKKLAIKKVFNISSYEEIIERSDNFDIFAMDPTNVIVVGLSIFEENDVAKTIINKYRLNNLQLTNEDLTLDGIDSLLSKIIMMLRIHEIESSELTMEKVWFIIEIEKMIEKEKKQTDNNE